MWKNLYLLFALMGSLVFTAGGTWVYAEIDPEILPEVFAEPAKDSSAQTLPAQSSSLKSEGIITNAGQEEGLADRPVIMDPVVVTASSIRMPLSAVASSITVITAADIENRKAHTLQDALQAVTGLEMVQNGGPGQLSSMFIRGAASERTLVLVNGVPVNDPITPARTTDLSRISLDNVRQIEIVRGPQSVVFGSGAMGGVINIITKTGAGPWQGSVSLEAGHYSTVLGTITASGSLDGVGFALSTSLENTQGFSAAKRIQTYSEPQPAMDADGYRRLTFDLNLDYHPVDNLYLKLSNRYQLDEHELDLGQGDSADDPNYRGQQVGTLNQFEMSWEVLPALWQQELCLGLSQSDRVTENTVDDIQPYSFGNDEYRARNITADWRQEFVLPLQTLSAGVNYMQEQGMGHSLASYGETFFAVRSAHLAGLYLEDLFRWQEFSLLLGTRYDTHDQYGGHFTYRITPAYTLSPTRTRFKATWGTAFNAPSLYRLYSKYGNTGLKPETAQGWDIGVEQSFPDERLRVAVTYFQTDYKDQIDFQLVSMDPVTWEIIGEYRNLNTTQTKGWEANLEIVPYENLQLRMSYTKLTANDLTDEETSGPLPLIRRADYKLSVNTNYRILGWKVYLGIDYVGPRWDQDYQTGSRKILAPYAVGYAALSYQFLPQAQAYVRINNLGDVDYEEILGYNTPRFAAYGGIKVNWP